MGFFTMYNASRIIATAVAAPALCAESRRQVPRAGSVDIALAQSLQVSPAVPASNDLLSKLIERDQ
jgi:hypothetical protein